MDATNYPSIKSAFDKIDGKVCITTEGLLMYLTDFELDALCDNIKKILAEHGGYWITLDPRYHASTLIVKAFYGERTREIMYTSKYRVEDKSDVTVIQNAITVSSLGDVQENMKNAMNYITSKGLKLEKIPYANHVSEFKSLENTDSEIVAKLRKALSKHTYGKLQSMNPLMLTFLMPRQNLLMQTHQSMVIGLSSYCQEI